MKSIKVMISKNNIEKLEKSYMDACHDEDFLNYVSSIDLSDDELMKYTSKLEECVIEANNCKKCPSKKECKNSVNGYCFKSFLENNKLNFTYVPCKYSLLEEELYSYQKKITCYDLPEDIKKATFTNIYKDDKHRLPIIKYFKEFIDSYLKKEPIKGVYLHGSFGSGKTYLIASLFNEMAKKDVSSIMVYYPELLRSLKSSFGGDYEEKFSKLKTVPLLLLDDIGAENTTNWSRDEVLAPLLQYRMENHLSTFFTSNLTKQELELTLSNTSNGIDKIKARRIIERINQLTVDLELISKNRRN